MTAVPMDFFDEVKRITRYFGGYGASGGGGQPSCLHIDVESTLARIRTLRIKLDEMETLLKPAPLRIVK